MIGCGKLGLASRVAARVVSFSLRLSYRVVRVLGPACLFVARARFMLSFCWFSSVCWAFWLFLSAGLSAASIWWSSLFTSAW